MWFGFCLCSGFHLKRNPCKTSIHELRNLVHQEQGLWRFEATTVNNRYSNIKMMDDLDLRYLGTAEKARITSHFVAQLKYYQDQKPWQYDLRNALWGFVVRTNKNFSGAQLREAANSACEQIGGILARMAINNAEFSETEDSTTTLIQPGKVYVGFDLVSDGHMFEF